LSVDDQTPGLPTGTAGALHVAADVNVAGSLIEPVCPVGTPDRAVDVASRVPAREAQDCGRARRVMLVQ